MRYNESEVQGLKAQEAKDYCLELMEQLKAKEGGPISPGEVQLQELQFELRLKEAEAEDNRVREEHEVRIKELEFEIEQEKKNRIEATQKADEVRAIHAETIAQVAQSQEKLSIQLERATREHAVKMQMMESEFEARRDAITAERNELAEQRDELQQEISRLGELRDVAQDIDQLRQDLESKRLDAQREQKQLAQDIEAAAFEKQQELVRTRREQEIELAELNATHLKAILEAKSGSLDELLSALGYEKIQPEELKRLQDQANQQQVRSEQEIAQIRDEAVTEFRRQFSISSSEPMNVTELFYAQKRQQEENESLQAQLSKMEGEISRMRSHIEKESERVAKAIEAARTNIQNNIEPGVKR
jgi:hypothetical protein